MTSNPDSDGGVVAILETNGADEAPAPRKRRSESARIEVPGPEDAWLRGGTAVPEGSTTEAAEVRHRKPSRIEEADDGGRSVVRGEGREVRKPPGAHRRRPPEGRRRPTPRPDAGPAADAEDTADDRQPAWLSDGRGPVSGPSRPAEPGPRRRSKARGQARQGSGHPPLDLADLPLPAGLDDDEGDPLKRALSLLSRIDDQAGEEPAAEREAADDGAGGDGGSNDGAPPTATGAEPKNPRIVEEPRRPRPARPIYTLQTIHERTGIPYATLALYAVSHRERIPFLGERHSPAYPREGLEEFCRIHEEKNPGWQRPAEGTEAGWDDESGLGVRLGALAEDQIRLADELRDLLAEVRRPWRGEAEWV